jgi:2-phosphosulfolactate phosphatase
MVKIQLDWELEGLKFALRNNDIVVIVDVLRFSSAVVTAIANGFTIYPVSDRNSGHELAASLNAEMSGKSGEARFSLSPLSYLEPSDQKQVVLYSPNGAACCELVKEYDHAYIGCLLNAEAVASHITKVAKDTGRDVTLIAAGEQRAIESGERIVYIKDVSRRVFAVEDYLGCGAIISSTSFSKTADARVCELAFKASQNKIENLLLESFSGKYLIQRDMAKGVEHVSRLNRYDTIPVIYDGKIKAYQKT